MADNPLRVLFVPDYSSLNPYQRRLAEALARCGVQVALSNGVGKLPLLGAVRAQGRPPLLHLHWTQQFLAAPSRTKSILLAFRFLGELLILKLSGIKIVWTIHNLLSHEKHIKRENVVNRIIANLCDQIIVHSNYGKKEVMSAYRIKKHSEKINIVPHGNFIDIYENNISREEARDALGVSEDAVVFLFFGLIRPYKGIFSLLQVFRELENPRALLFIVGRPLTEALQQGLEAACRAEERIRLHLRAVPPEAVQVYMAACDAVVFPYEYILTSGSVWLAMSFGKAIVASRLPYFEEVLAPQGAFLYQPGDRLGLRRALEAALEADLRAMGKWNRVRAEAVSWEHIGEKTREVYLKCWQ